MQMSSAGRVTKPSETARRGRKPKTTSVETTDDFLEEDTDDEIGQSVPPKKASGSKGRAGRPPSSAPLVTEPRQEMDWLDEPKRKPGRPRTKSTVTASTESSSAKSIKGRPKIVDSEDVAEPETQRVAVRKARGRTSAAPKVSIERSNIVSTASGTSSLAKSRQTSEAVKKKKVTFSDLIDSDLDEVADPAPAPTKTSGKTGLGAKPVRKAAVTTTREVSSKSRSAGKPLSPKKTTQITRSAHSSESDAEEDELSGAKTTHTHAVKSPAKTPQPTVLLSPVKKVNFVGPNTPREALPRKEINENDIPSSHHPPSVAVKEPTLAMSPARRLPGRSSKELFRETPRRGLLFASSEQQRVPHTEEASTPKKSTASPLKASPRKGANFAASLFGSPQKGAPGTPFNNKPSLLRSPARRVQSPFVFRRVAPGSRKLFDDDDHDVEMDVSSDLKVAESPRRVYTLKDTELTQDNAGSDDSDDVFVDQPMVNERDAHETDDEVDFVSSPAVNTGAKVPQTIADDADEDDHKEEETANISEAGNIPSPEPPDTLQEATNFGDSGQAREAAEHEMVAMRPDGDDVSLPHPEIDNKDMEEGIDADEDADASEHEPGTEEEVEASDSDDEGHQPQAVEFNDIESDDNEPEQPNTAADESSDETDKQIAQEDTQGDDAHHDHHHSGFMVVEDDPDEAQENPSEDETDRESIVEAVEHSYDQHADAAGSDQTTEEPERVSDHADGIETSEDDQPEQPQVEHQQHLLAEEDATFQEEREDSENVASPAVTASPAMSYSSQTPARSTKSASSEEDYNDENNVSISSPVQESQDGRSPVSFTGSLRYGYRETADDGMTESEASFISRRSSLASRRSILATPSASSSHLPFTPLAAQLGHWKPSTPKSRRKSSQRSIFSPVIPKNLSIRSKGDRYSQIQSMRRSLAARHSLASTVTTNDEPDAIESENQTQKEVHQDETPLQKAQNDVEASEEEIPETPKQEPLPSMSITPVRINRDAIHVSHTVSKVPLKPEGEYSPIKNPRKRPRSLSIGLELPIRASPRQTNSSMPTSQTEPALSPEESQSRPESVESRPSTPSQSGSAKTPRQKDTPKKSILRGAVVYVDVHTSEGEDASGIFIDLLTEMGAKCVRTWSWNPRGSDSPSVKDATPAKVGITHVVFKDGGVRTLEKVRQAANLVKCVGVGWVLDCERENKWLDETNYLVDCSIIPRGGAKRRKSMEPRAVTNINGSITPASSSSGYGAGANRRRSSRYSLAAAAAARRRETLEFNKPAMSPPPSNGESFLTRLSPEREGSAPKTPTASTPYKFDFEAMSPVTPYYPSSAKSPLVQQTCPPKQTRRGLFDVQDEHEERISDLRAKLEAARRKSLAFKPTIGSPLGRS